MGDAGIASCSALHGLMLPGRVGVATIADAGPRSRFVFRGEPSALGVAFGVSLPEQPCRSAMAGERAALWLGPDEWLLLDQGSQGEGLRRELLAVLTGKAASLVDVSRRNAGLIVGGPKAALLINAGCPLDLDINAFPTGMVARTIFGKAEIILWRTGAEAFHVEVWRSFAPYVCGLFAEAMRDLD